jgi:hypothetical protein
VHLVGFTIEIFSFSVPLANLYSSVMDSCYTVLSVLSHTYVVIICVRSSLSFLLTVLLNFHNVTER